MSEKVCNLIGGGMKEAINLIYPVGRTIICDHSPQTDYPWQTWTQDFRDVFPLGAGDTYAAGVTGGEARHTLTVDEIPTHRHQITAIYSSGNDSNYNWINVQGGSANQNNVSIIGDTSAVGGGGTHNNMPPYKAVKYWTRTA